MNANESDPTWRVATPWIVAIVGMDEVQLQRLISLLKEAESPVHSFGWHTFRQLTENLSLHDQRRLLDALSRTGNMGARQVIHIISMTVHGNADVPNDYRREILDLLIHFPWNGMTDDNNSMDYNIETIFGKIVAGFATPDDVAALIEVLDPRDDERNWFLYNAPRKTALREMFRYFPEACISRFCIPDEDGSYNFADGLCRTISSHREGFIETVPDTTLLDWVNVTDPNDRQARVEFVARTCRLLECETGGMREPTGFRSLASDLARLANNPAVVLKVFADRAVGSSFTGSIANHIRVRRGFFDGLDLDNRPETTQGLEKALAYLDGKIAREQAREDEEARASAERFE